MLAIQGMVQNKEIGLLKLFEEAAVECRLIWSCLKTHAFCMILPWLHLFTYPAITNVGAVLKSDISCESILQSESKLWLRLINRRIGGCLRIRNPYHAEMKIIQRSHCNGCRTLE